MLISASMNISHLRDRMGRNATSDQARQLRALLVQTDHVSVDDITDDEFAELCERATCAQAA